MSETIAITGALSSSPDVRLAYVFGSVATGHARPESDLDIAVLLSPGAGPSALEDLQSSLESVSKRRVDLVDLRRAPPLLAHAVLTQGKLILCRNEGERVAFVTRALSRYMDTTHLRRVQHEYLAERAETRRAARQ